MIQVWKILHGHDHVNKNKWFSSAYVPGENERQTRMSSDPLNLKLPYLVCTPKYEVINIWNNIQTFS